MARSSVEESARTRKRVLETAISLFDARGYASTTLEDIARAASVTRGAVYHHFGNKLGLFTEVMSLLQAEVAIDVAAGAESAGCDPFSQLRAGSHAFLDAITQRPRLTILLVQAPSVVGWRAWREFDAVNSEAHLRDGLREIGIPESLLEALTVQLSGAMNEAALWVADQGNRDGARTQAHDALDLVLESLLR